MDKRTMSMLSLVRAADGSGSLRSSSSRRWLGRSWRAFICRASHRLWRERGRLMCAMRLRWTGRSEPLDCVLKLEPSPTAGETPVGASTGDDRARRCALD